MINGYFFLQTYYYDMNFSFNKLKNDITINKYLNFFPPF